MPGPDLRVRFFITFQVNQIGLDLIPFYPVGLQLRVTTFLTFGFALKRGERGSDFDMGFTSEWICPQAKFTKLGALQAICGGFDSLHPLHFSTLHSGRFTASTEF